MPFQPRPLAKLLCCLFLLAAPAYAQNEVDDLRGAVTMAVTNQPLTRNSWFEFQASLDAREAAFGGYLPRVDLQANWVQEKRERPGLFGTSTSDLDGDSYALVLRQMIFDGFATPAEVGRLDHLSVAAYYRWRQSAEETALEASRAFLDLLRFKELNSLAEQNLKAHETTLKQIEERVGAGVSKGVDREQAIGRLALARSNLLTERSNLQDVNTRFQRVVGSRPAAELKPLPSITGAVPDGAVGTGALDSAPQLLATLAETDAARRAHEGAQAGYYPSLELQARRDDGNDIDGVTGDQETTRVAVVLSYNLFAGGSDRARDRQFANQLAAAQSRRDASCREVGQIVAVAWSDLLTLREQIASLEQHVQSMTKVREAYRQQFQLGQRSLLDLLDTENELFQAQRALINGRYDLELAAARVLAPRGQLLNALRINTEKVADAAPNVVATGCTVPALN
ncbi:TolC family outer membrane protein [Permianibacter sp. IMCC34836]|uniref:TolC family outer membrane protein n=1 Tax=Permianibacter fluminis TaxID=2738515 RepID=UPI001555EBE5|nr:TolC family outer membrane protein [Permianibacter fluminis]NQD38892.1 TolC family outer membrane protein [Permianibacter fluminis]